ncbi:MAG TPA: hypothetical protein VFA26_15120, partial [Gemmataceae bacterium]|nr:hypothetical protein [Gemmataceae bacterium]
MLQGVVPVSRLGALRAPRADRAVLAYPPLEAVGGLLERNRDRLARARFDLLGRPFPDLRREAARQLLDQAADYFRSSGEPVPDVPDGPILLAGHQPELFHPGVWVKNFALHGLARRHGAVPVNLVVDNDTVKSTALRLPAFRDPPPPVTEFLPHLVTVPFDYGGHEAPYEERPVLDEAVFASFPERARQPWGFTPMLGAFWNDVLAQARRTPLLGERFAAARRAWERRWGCHNFEVPVSRVCGTAAFGWFACHLLAELPRFHAIYNEAVHDYRRRHGIRSRNHPVPDLAADGDWLEAPFWAWRSHQPEARATGRRGRLMARRRGDRVELRVGEEAWPALRTPYSVLGTPWEELGRQGCKVRSRALTNTLYARLFLGETFLHGIGGGKYDELTDAILRRFYGIEPPEYVVLSATLLLPFPEYPARPEDCRRLAHELRDVYWNPQRHLGATEATLRELVEERREWVERRPETRRGRRERFRKLTELTERLRPAVAGQEAELRRRLEVCALEVGANAVLRRRDYAFCLYP